MPKKEIEEMPSEIQKLVVHKPHKFISFGWFLPIKKMPRLNLFKAETLEIQLKNAVKQINNKQLYAKKCSFIISFPKFIKWFARDFMDDKDALPCFVRIMESFYENEVYTSSKCDQDTLRTLVKMMKEERRITGKILHQFDFVVFAWKIEPEVMKKAIESIKADE